MRSGLIWICCHLCWHLIFTRHINTLWTVSALDYLVVVFCVCVFRQTPIPMGAWRVSLSHVAHRFDRGALYFCGFPTLQHIRHKVSNPQPACLQMTTYYPINGDQYPIITGLMLIFLLYVSHSFIRRKVEWWCFNKAAEGRTWYWRF